MASDDIIQNLISQLGQSQGDRRAPELALGFADIDERGLSEQLLLCQALAKLVRFYPTDGTAPGDWTTFFPFDADDVELVHAAADGRVTPHLGLLATFLELREEPRRLMNGVTLRHLDFQYQRVLGFQNRPAVPDRAHVLFELKKGAPSAPVPRSTELSAGKDATGVDRVYMPVRDAVINAAKVDSLCSIFVDDHVHAAPVANSGDGTGGPLAADQPGWSPFGDAGMKVGATGFALSSPVLRMTEGTRTVTLSLRVTGGGPSAPGGAALGTALEAYFTGAKSWLGPYDVTGSSSGTLLQLEIAIPATSPAQAIVDYDPAVHGESLAAGVPVVQLLIKPAAAVPTHALRGLVLHTARISVDVQGLASSLTLESDSGTLDPKKTFLPFGAQPSKGSRFMIGCPEATSKILTEIGLTISWHDPPASFATAYQGYLSPNIDASYFTATVTFADATGDQPPFRGERLFPGSTADPTTITLKSGSPSPSPPMSAARRVYALGSSRSAAAVEVARGQTMLRPILATFLSTPPPSPTGFVTMTLEHGFLQDVFRRKTIEGAMNHVPGSTPFALLPEPYLPAIDRFSLSYKATTSEVQLDDATEESFSNLDVGFFHVDCFGQRREHGYLRKQLAYVTHDQVPLFPPHDRQGELLIGVTGVAAGDSVSLLIEIAEGSADPDIAWPKVHWSVLADNYWRKLGPGELVLDTTDELRASGLVVVDLPLETTAANTLLPAGRVWLRAAVADGADGVSRLIQIAANGVEVAFVDRGNDPARLATPLPAGSLRKLKTPIASAKAVSQPYASFGGRTSETDDAVRMRAAERLRHKGRAVTPWDYERLVLEAFPEVHRVKCIPHAKRGSWQAPGNVLLIVVPDTRNLNARDPLKPRVDADTLARIAAYVQPRAGMQVAVAVHNPTFQKVRLDFKVKLRVGFPFNTYAPLLIDAIKNRLSPWANDAAQEIVFGGRIYRSALLDFVEQQGYVDYVTDFRMRSYVDVLAGAPDVSSASPETPDAILVSDATHDVAEVP